jgi:hypothetical protein
MEIVDRLFQAGDCELEEGTVGGTGYRRLLRFDTVIINAGDGDQLVGDPSDGIGPYDHNFFFAECHGHYHNEGFSDYGLFETDGVTVAAPGHKQAFCLEDNLRYTNDAKRKFVSCGFQGITSGYGDWYYKQLSGPVDRRHGGSRRRLHRARRDQCHRPLPRRPEPLPEHGRSDGARARPAQEGHHRHGAFARSQVAPGPRVKYSRRSRGGTRDRGTPVPSRPSAQIEWRTAGRRAHARRRACRRPRSPSR